MNAFQALWTALFHRWTDTFRRPEDRGYDPKPIPKRPMIAICVGHSRSGDKGATSVTGVSEWDFWQPIAYRVVELLRQSSLPAKVVDIYEGKSYGTAINWLARHLKEMSADLAIELHFNSASESANGYEFLHWEGSKKGAALALDLDAAHRVTFPNARSRGVKTKGPGSRGALFLKRTPCPAVICEAFFGSNRDEWAYYSAKTEELAQAIALGIKNNSPS